MSSGMRWEAARGHWKAGLVAWVRTEQVQGILGSEGGRRNTHWYTIGIYIPITGGRARGGMLGTTVPQPRWRQMDVSAGALVNP